MQSRAPSRCGPLMLPWVFLCSNPKYAPLHRQSRSPVVIHRDWMHMIGWLPCVLKVLMYSARRPELGKWPVAGIQLLAFLLLTCLCDPSKDSL
jgi:hypothetical protein